VSTGHPAAIAVVLEALIRGEAWDRTLARFGDWATNGIVLPSGLTLEPSAPVPTEIVQVVSETNKQLVDEVVRDPTILWRLPSRKFEEIVADLLHKNGYTVEVTPPTRDGGFDVFAAHSDLLGEFLYLVECKRYAPSNKVGVQVVRSLHGVVQASRATAGVVMTTSFFTRDAAEFHQSVSHQLQLRDYDSIRRWIEGSRGA
jgi:restriction system protein